MPEIITAKSAGFCFGVERALQMVYEQAECHDRIYTLGPRPNAMTGFTP